MTSTEADIKPIVNTLYRGTIVSVLAIGYARLSKLLFGGSSAKLDFSNARDVGMLVVDIAGAMATKDFLVKQGIIPADILK